MTGVGLAGDFVVGTVVHGQPLAAVAVVAPEMTNRATMMMLIPEIAIALLLANCMFSVSESESGTI
jgi:hypothetical protein